MNKTKVTSGMAMSIDGFTARLNQSFENPFGDNFDPDLLNRWMFAEPEKSKHKKEIEAIKTRFEVLITFLEVCYTISA